MGVNAKIQDRAISHQIGILRRAGGVRNKVLKHLEDVEEDLIAKVAARGGKGAYTTAQMQTALQQIQEIIASARRETLDIVKNEMFDIAQWESEFNKKLIQGSIGVNLNMTLPDPQRLKSVVTSRPFQGRLLRDWISSFHKAQQKMIAQAIRIGISEGETNDAIVKRIRGTRANNYTDGVAAVSRRQAEAVVRTATNHTSSGARSELFRENRDVIKNEVYVATLDSRTTPTCQALDGKVIEVGGGPRPPQHVGCRSTTSPVTKSFQELGLDINEVPAGTRASIDGEVPSKTTYADWLRRQDKATQIDVLGETKAELFRKGNITLDRFVDAAGNELSIEQLKTRDLQAFARAGIDPDTV